MLNVDFSLWGSRANTHLKLEFFPRFSSLCWEITDIVSAFKNSHHHHLCTYSRSTRQVEPKFFRLVFVPHNIILVALLLHQKFGGMFLKCVLCKFLFLSLALSSRLAYHDFICTSLTRKKTYTTSFWTSLRLIFTSSFSNSK